MQTDLGDAIRAPFPRQAIMALNNGLREADRTAAAVFGGEKIAEVFQEAHAQGASANLCDAVAALARYGHGIGVSLRGPQCGLLMPTTGVPFSESTADVFAQGAELLRQNSPSPNEHVIGEIVGLDRQRQEEFDGQSVLVCELDGRPVACKFSLMPPTTTRYGGLSATV